MITYLYALTYMIIMLNQKALISGLGLRTMTIKYIWKCQYNYINKNISQCNATQINILICAWLAKSFLLL